MQPADTTTLSPLDLDALADRIAAKLAERGAGPAVGELLTESEFCALTGIKPQTARAWRTTRTRGPKFIKLGDGGSVRYRRADVVDWMREHTHATSEQK